MVDLAMVSDKVVQFRASGTQGGSHTLIIMVPGRYLAWMETGKLHCMVILGAVKMSA